MKQADINKILENSIETIRQIGDIRPISTSIIEYYANSTNWGFIYLTESNFSITIRIQDSMCTFLACEYDKISNNIIKCYADKERYSESIEIVFFVNELKKRIESINKIDNLRNKLQSDFSKYLINKFNIRSQDSLKYNYSDIIEDLENPEKKERLEIRLRTLIKQHSERTFDAFLYFLPYNLKNLKINTTLELIEFLNENSLFQKIRDSLDRLFDIWIGLLTVDQYDKDPGYKYDEKEKNRIYLYINDKNAL